jgi:dipeptidase E
MVSLFKTPNPNQDVRLLLLSNSTNPGEQYLEWATQYIADFYHRYGIKKILFIPYAGVTVNWDDYEAKVQSVFSKLDLEIISIHRAPNAIIQVEKAEAIAVGGGNTFQLLKLVHYDAILEPIKQKVRYEGMPYAGWSAGSNLACPTIRTTNDMPIVEPRKFDSFGFLPFQINPHYLDANPEGHGGETRQQRIEEFLEANQKITVAGLREASLLEVFDNKIELKGRKPMRVFKYKTEPQEFQPGDNIQFLLAEMPKKA